MSSASGTVARAVARLRPQARSVAVVHRGTDPLWAGVAHLLRQEGRDVADVALPADDRSWRLPPTDGEGRLLLPGGARTVDVLVYHDPFGPSPAASGGDDGLDRLYALLEADIAAVFVAYPHGLSAGAERVERAFRAALAAEEDALVQEAETLAARISDGRPLTVGSGGGAVLTVSPPFRVRDDFTSARLDVPVLQLPYGEVWVVADPERFNGDVELAVSARGRVRASVRAGWMEWRGGEPLAETALEHPVVEVGFGINPAAPWLPSATLFEKNRGSAHIGLGDSALIGGGRRAAVHFDLPLAPCRLRRLEHETPQEG